jgi:N2,N2-dimethylguanosine tRNA methyltransferase
MWCSTCGTIEKKNALAVFVDEICPNCQSEAAINSKHKISGLLWLGSLKDVSFYDDVLVKLEALPLNKKAEAVKLLTI